MNEQPCDERPMPKWLPMLVFILMTEIVFVSLGLIGCKETVNTNPDMRQRDSLLFFNYSVRAPDLDRVVVKEQKKLGDKYAGLSIRVLTFNHFIPPSVTEQFMEETGARITIDTYDNTTELRERLRSGEKVDLILTASFMLEQLRDEDRLLPIDKKNIPLMDRLGPDYLHPAFDPTLAYFVPYLWTTVGIAYNADSLDILPQVWGDLLLPAEDQVPLLRSRVALLPVPQRAYGTALIHLGYSINTKSKDELIEAAKLVSKQNEILRFKFGRATMIEGLSTGELLMAEAYGNEAAQAQARNRSVRFCIPEDGSWVTQHCFAIPKATTPSKKELAEVFVNFVLQPTVAADVVNYSLCASTIPETSAYVRSNVRLGPTYMLPSDPSKRFLQAYTPEMEELRNRLWQELTGGMPMDIK